MRITGGTHRGRILQSPKDSAIRPTSDKVRLAVFNMLESRGLVRDAAVLDAFCGTGALGLEALSRGSLCCTFMDKNRGSLELAKANFAALKMGAKENFVFGDAAKPGAVKVENGVNPAASLVFLDPPYNKNFLQQSIPALFACGWIAAGAWLVMEAEKTFDPACLASIPVSVDMVRDYGDTRIMLGQIS